MTRVFAITAIVVRRPIALSSRNALPIGRTMRSLVRNRTLCVSPCAFVGTDHGR